MSSKGVSVGILVFILIVMVVYVVVMFELYTKQLFLFAPYTPPTPPANTFHPLGKVVPLSSEAIQRRNEIILRALGAA